MPRRVVVFIDAQNVYNGAREAFHEFGNTTPQCGQVSPLRVGQEICAQIPDAELTQVRSYRGLPSNKHSPEGYGASRRQTAAWMSEQPRGLVDVTLRPLQYLSGMTPREKGIDVQLAIDFVVMAVSGQYDIGVLFSTDTDLRPALEAVYDLGGQEGPSPWVAGWQGPYWRPRRIGPSGNRNAPVTWLDEGAYRRVRDHTRYNDPPIRK